MNFLNKMERKFGKYAIHNLMFYIIVLYGCGFLIMNFAPADVLVVPEPGCAGDPARADLAAGDLPHVSAQQ